MSSQDVALQALAELEKKLDAGVEAVRARSAEAKSRLESGMLNLRPAAGPSSKHSDNGVAELSWDLESAAAADSGAIDQLDELAATPLEMAAFDDEFDASRDEG